MTINMEIVDYLTCWGFTIVGMIILTRLYDRYKPTRRNKRRQTWIDRYKP